MLFAWHRMLTNGRRDLTSIGNYRTGAEPMQIVSGTLGSPNLHFEAPPSARVHSEMARFVKWFNRTSPNGRDALPALTRAGAAHIYFESIHPFEDGNGRIGRAISDKALAQSAGQPTLTALAGTMLIGRKAYYAARSKLPTRTTISRRGFAGSQRSRSRPRGERRPRLNSCSTRRDFWIGCVTI
jgi:Fic family protein